MLDCKFSFLFAFPGTKIVNCITVHTEQTTFEGSRGRMGKVWGVWGVRVSDEIPLYKNAARPQLQSSR